MTVINFQSIKTAVAKQFAKMQKGQLFRVSVDKDTLWQTYLSSFPEGTNPIYRQRTEHDCNCCKQFVRVVGDVVSIDESGKVTSIWDVLIPDEPAYQTVTNAMAAYVHSNPVTNTFLHYEANAGTDKSFENVVGQTPVQHNHFFVTIDRKFLKANHDIPTELNATRTKHQTLKRALDEISMDAVDTVLELVTQNSIYKGTDYKFALTEFKKLQEKYQKVPSELKNSFVWNISIDAHGAVAGIRNTAIGTLLVDLSNGKELEASVKAYEIVVAPSNYKRSTALVTKNMIDAAKKKIAELGLTSALERRYATIDDISINNLLHANRSTKKALNVDVFDTIATKPKEFGKVEKISVEKFLADVLPVAESIEVMVGNNHASNFMSLIAPVDPTAGKLLKWGNEFSWSYAGDVTDSIKERVKAAGGNVTGDLCCRLAWYNYDDLDLHMVEPDGTEVNFRTRAYTSVCGGQLDVDMNARSASTRTPVENIFYGNIKHMRAGVYRLYVNSWQKRESKDVGFEVEISLMGETFNFVHDKMVATHSNVTVCEFVSDGKGNVTIRDASKMNSTKKSKEIWNVNTNQFTPVSAVMFSPNYWDDNSVGNKHLFFMLENCRNTDSARGLYNEFIREDLNAHRKVIEMVGAKLKTDNSMVQLSGVGFSLTQRNELTVKVNGKTSRVFTVMF